MFRGAASTDGCLRTLAYWAALLAAQVLVENKSLGQVAERNRPKVERIRTWLVRTLQHNALPAVDRVQAGNALADVGDPRFRADAWYLPDESAVGVCGDSGRTVFDGE